MRLRRNASWLLVAGGMVAGGPLAAQSGAVVSREVVQPLPSPSSGALNRALQRLAVNARDAGALVDAGFAALDIGDVDAAVGFFSRADAVEPGNPRAQAGLGAAYVRSENPYDALLMFEEAERAGAAPLALAGDRGLALDLVGDTASAQSYYRKALSLGPNAEVTRRMAVSLAISGDKAGAEAALLPLLKKQDLAAYRARAFVLAISGQAKEAQQIVDQVMPRAMAGKLAPYLRYMPRLTPAQQAAAANFGQFPSVAQIGKQDPRAAKYVANVKQRPVPPSGVAVAAAPAQSALVPTGEPFGRKGESASTTRTVRNSGRARQTVAVAAPKAAPVASSRPVTTASGELPAVGQAQSAYTSAMAQPAAAAQTYVPPPPPYMPPRAAVANAAARPSIAIPDYPAPTQTAAALVTVPGFAKPIAPSTGSGTGDAAIASYGAASTNTPGRTAYGLVQGPGAASMPEAAAAAQRTATAVPAAAVSPVAAVVTSPPATAVSVTATGQAYGPVLQDAPAQATASPDVTVPAQASGSSPVIQPAPVLEATAAGVVSSGPVNLADAFADFALPTTAQRAPGAVDITRITPHRDPSPVEQAVAAGKGLLTSPQLARDAAAAKDTAGKAAAAAAKGAKPVGDPKSAAAVKGAKAQKDVKPKPPVQPSRVWVQLATGRDTGALGFDWRRMSKSAAELFKGRQGYVAAWGQSNRLLTGPFSNAAAAQEFVSKLKKEDVASFVFTSKEGEEIKPLSAR